MEKQKVKIKYKEQQLSDKTKELVLFNDDHHSFDFVIGALIEVCHHEPEQAEQCAFIAHHKGKCTVMTGNEEELKPYFEGLILRGLFAEIIQQ